MHPHPVVPDPIPPRSRAMVFLSGMLFLGVCLALLFAWSHAWGAPAAQYTLTDLGEGIAATIAHDAPTVVGTRIINRQQFAAQLSPTSATLGTLPGGLGSRATGVLGGRIVGDSGTGPNGFYTHGFLYQNGVMRDLGTTGAMDLFSSATDLNTTDITGYGDSPDRRRTVPVLWVDGTAILQLPTLGGTTGSVDAINAMGDAVGNSDTATGQTHCTLWKAMGELVDCHSASGGTLSFGLGINTAGQIVGQAYPPSGQHGFVWLPLTGMVLLPPLPGDTTSSAYAINADGDIVGYSTLESTCACPPLHQAATLWVNGQPIDLNTRVTNGDGVTLTAAVGISDDGVIVGYGTINGAVPCCSPPFPPRALPPWASRPSPRRPLPSSKPIRAISTVMASSTRWGSTTPAISGSASGGMRSARRCPASSRAWRWAILTMMAEQTSSASMAGPSGSAPTARPGAMCPATSPALPPGILTAMARRIWSD
jgi:probable HAF family extracellular repeat protein